MAAPPGRAVVAVDAPGATVGSASMYPNRSGGGGHVASASFMVNPDRSGLGTGLLVMHRFL
jgi:hypothetical protein